MFVVPNRNCEPLLLSLTADEADANDYIDDNNDRRNAMQWKPPPFSAWYYISLGKINFNAQMWWFYGIEPRKRILNLIAS